RARPVALCRLPGELACLKIPPRGRRKTTNTVRRRLPCRIGCRSARRAVAGSVTRGWVAARLLAKRAHWRWKPELLALLVSFRGTLGPGDLLVLLAVRAAAEVHSFVQGVRGRTRMAG